MLTIKNIHKNFKFVFSIYESFILELSVNNWKSKISLAKKMFSRLLAFLWDV